jgi:type IV pilus assembly protein PilN
MIRINLLPESDRRQGRGIKLPSISLGAPIVIWLVAGLVVVGGVITAIAMLQSSKIRSYEQKIAEAREEADRLAPQLERIRKLTREREEVNRRLAVIAALDRDRYFRVQLLNDVSMQLPQNCWLLSLQEQGGTSMMIEGVTFSNYLIADLMNNLEKTDRFDAVNLTIAQEGKIMDHRVIQFTLQSNVSSR